MMVVPKLKSIEEVLRAVSPETYKIACVNWPAEYPYAPEATFGIAHTGHDIVLRFRVNEQNTMAVVTRNNGPVWEDSCAEFFLSLDDTGYYNFEFNCIGAKLLGFRKEKDAAVHASEQIMSSIKTFPSLGTEPVNMAPARWSLDVIIPARALFRHSIEDLSGLSAKANFYKCGDKLTEPHFLSYAPIEWPRPNFHLEQFFTGIIFEK